VRARKEVLDERSQAQASPVPRRVGGACLGRTARGLGPDAGAAGLGLPELQLLRSMIHEPKLDYLTEGLLDEAFRTSGNDERRVQLVRASGRHDVALASEQVCC
jgi:hypothetical protein